MPLVHYMPIVGPHTLRLEALSADPGVFAGLTQAQAEAYDREVRFEACQRVAKCDIPDLELSVNVFPRCLADPCFANEIAELLLGTGLAPELLILELVETEPLRLGRTTRRNLALVARMGVRLAFDDYGQGYATAKRVTRALEVCAFHSLKAGWAQREEAASLAARYGLELTIERVETCAQYDEVMGRGFLAQGYYVGRKFPFHHLAAWMEGWGR